MALFYVLLLVEFFLPLIVIIIRRRNKPGMKRFDVIGNDLLPMSDANVVVVVASVVIGITF
ncbi:hypothetical protein DWR06_07510 [Salmonella enterica]|nr:hypothetical protein [Salmonella enterica]EBV3858937.1 hypothetical protein [Salmonella enterica subsp. enterica serovar Montevideo]ECA8460215.1 hypothetical protein [Salmonella enterica subsp. enterica serovar Muenchen]EAM5846811.1 hypothetical protein [Salmonella enterica]EAM5856153.1 hypothetical protein [Salmonella enterica]